MKPSNRTLTFSFVLLCVTSASAVADSTENDHQSTHTAATELHWVNSGFGPQVSPVNGDFSNGEHVTYVKFTAGMATPLHTHTADYVGIVITGVTMHWEPGKPETEKQLSAGAHWFMPANVRHVSECLPGAECIMALYQSSSMDFLPTAQ